MTTYHYLNSLYRSVYEFDEPGLVYKWRMRKIKYYTRYRFYSKDGTANVSSRTVSFKKVPPLQISDCCELVGAIPDHVGSNIPKPLIPNINFLKFLSKYGNKYLYQDELNSLNKVREVWPGNIATYQKVLDTYALPIPKGSLTAKELLDIYDEEKAPWIELPKMPMFKEEDLDLVYIKPDANPGHYTSKIFGHSRRHSVSQSLECAKDIFRHLKNKLTKWNGLWSLAGRAKDIKIPLAYDTEDLTTRAIWVPEEPLILLGGIITQPFTRHLGMLGMNCLFIAKNFTHEDLAPIIKVADTYPLSIQVDWSLWDANLYPEIIRAAFQILRRCYEGKDYKENRFIDRYFFFLYDTIINKNIIYPPGYVYKIKKGIPFLIL